jgi:hypothetical protein
MTLRSSGAPCASGRSVYIPLLTERETWGVWGYRHVAPPEQEPSITNDDDFSGKALKRKESNYSLCDKSLIITPSGSLSERIVDEMIKQISRCVILIGVWMLFVPISASACSCDFRFPVKSVKQQVVEARMQSKAVFSGEVVEIIADPPIYSLRVKFRVEKYWKGVLSNEVIVVTGRGGGDCGYRFKVGAHYLVFAYGVDTRLGTNICQRTKELAEAAEDLKLLGKGKPRTTL